MTNELVEQPSRASALAMTGRGQGAALVPQNLGDVVTFSALMARAGHAVPKHLRENQGACFAVCMRAFSLEMEPFAFASKTYFVNDNMAFEAQLVAAIVISRAPIVGRPVYEFTGAGPTRQCTVTVEIAGGIKLPYTSPQNQQIKVKNSPLWQSDLDQQLGYYSIRALGRRHFPEVLMGIYTPEERMAGMDDDDKVVSFDTMEQRAIAAQPVQAVVVEEKKPARQPAKPAANPEAREDPAGHASSAGTATDGGTPATGGDTGRPSNEGENLNKGPQTDAAAQNAAAAKTTSASAMPASGASAEETSSPAPTKSPTEDGETFPGDLPIAATHESAPPHGDAIDPDLAAFAAGLADAGSWPACIKAFVPLSRSTWFASADYEARERCRASMYHRLLALRDRGENTDPALDMHAYRAFIAYETDIATMRGVRDAAAASPAWERLDSAAKKQLDAAWARRVDVLSKVSEFA